MTKQEPGYRIERDATRSILKLRLWGMWDSALVQKFEREVKPNIVQMSRDAPQGWYSLVDLSGFPPQFAEAQEMTREVMQFEVAHGMKKGAALMAKSVTKLQIQRLAKQEGFDPGSFFQAEDEAIRWLLSGE